MPPRLLTGNASDADANEFGGWFIGDIEAWSKRRNADASPEATREQFGIRNTRALEVKWGLHPAGQERPNGWSGPGDTNTMSILISGAFLLEFREDHSSPRSEVRLSNVGDYAVWGSEYHHHWRALADSVVLTVRWKE